MELSEFTVRLILIFTPGLISLFIIEYFVTIKEIKLHRLITYSFLLGIICYMIYYMIIIVITVVNNMISHKLVFDINTISFSFLDSMINSELDLNFKEILAATTISIFVGCIFSYFIKYKLLYRIAYKIKLSNKHGDIDLWSSIMNNDKIPKLVIIKDKEKNRIYYGWVGSFSSIKDILEIYLYNVTIYESQGNEITNKFYTPGLYLTRKSDNIEMQFPYPNLDEIEKVLRKEEMI